MNINPNIAVNENGFVFNAERGDAFSANLIGAEIIRLLKQGKTISEIETHIGGRYDVEAAIVEKDVKDFLMMLRQFQILEAI